MNSEIALMETSIADRLKIFMDHEGLNNSNFAERCGIPKPSLSQILTGRNKKVSNQLLETIHKAFPEINMLWLIFGEGSMLNNFDNSFSSPEDQLEVRSEPESYFGSQLGFDVANSPTDYSVGFENSNLRGLTEAKSKANPNGNQPTEYGLKIRDLQLQIENLQRQIDVSAKNPRRVTQITVYYDDSTFETFRPE